MPSGRPRLLTGYRVGDYALKMNQADATLGLKMKADPSSSGKTCSGVVAPVVLLHGPALPSPLLPYIPCLTNPWNQAAACVHRFGCTMPARDGTEMKKLLDYAVALFKQEFKPLLETELLNHTEWLSQTSYPGERCDALRRLRLEVNEMTNKRLSSKCFTKEECYSEPKCPRAINSPDDATKTVVGALIASMEKKAFKHKVFAKGTRPADMPARLFELFGMRPVVETDFSSFEAHHSGLYTEIVKRWMMHMVRDLPNANAIKRVICLMMETENVCKFKHLIARVAQRLMSGVMWTSCGNGILNMVIMSYLQLVNRFPNLGPQELALKFGDCKLIVEGDDGMSEAFPYDEEMIKKLGLRLKFHQADFFGAASFCGNVCDPTALVVVTDPLKTIRKMFVLPRRYKQASEKKQLALQRAKALSLKYQYPNAPVVGALCDWVLLHTRGVDVGKSSAVLDQYHRHLLEGALREKVWQKQAVVAHSSRVVVQERFGLSIPEQVRIEASLQGPVSYCDLTNHMTMTDWKHTCENLLNTSEGQAFPGVLPPDLVKLVGRQPQDSKAARRLRNNGRRPLQVPFDVSAYAEEINRPA